ncbi:MAG: LPS export ABC transporter ATP-binding protein [Desulfuromonas sp.]|nr:MAG: LPS export ABC transporter ATP-binding protein [Desulfuromonas sp.]
MNRELVATGLRKSYQGRPVVRNVDLKLSSGEVVGLLGPNGAGKTTSFYMVVGLVRPDAGEVFLDGERLTGEPMFRRARLGISYLPQEPSVFRRLKVDENLTAVLETLGLDRNGCRERAEELLEQFRLTKVAKSYGYALSGGERRRLEIARALVVDPAFMLLDEPFSGIDPIAVHEIQEIIHALRGNGIGILISDHNVRETLGVCDRAYILNDGAVLEHGSPEQISESPQARRFYLGDHFRL